MVGRKLRVTGRWKTRAFEEEEEEEEEEELGGGVGGVCSGGGVDGDG